MELNKSYGNDAVLVLQWQGGVKDSHPLNTTETGDKRRVYVPLGSERTSNDEKTIFAIVNKLLIRLSIVSFPTSSTMPLCINFLFYIIPKEWSLELENMLFFLR